MEQPEQLELYIVGPEDTLAGIALSRNTTIREIKAANKLWGDTIWPGQKLRVKKKERAVTEEGSSSSSSSHANSRDRSSTSSSKHRAANASSVPLLVRLRDLFDRHDTIYAHAVVLPAPRRIAPRVTASSRAHLSAHPQLRQDSEDHVISIAAVLLRLHPFLAVNGTVTLTPTRLMFLPNPHDPQVRKLGTTSLQVDLPTSNVKGCRRVKPADLDTMIAEDVGLELQEDQRFLEVLYKQDKNNIVAPREAKKRNDTPKKLGANEDDLSIFFMLSPESLSVIRAQLVRRLEQVGSSSICPNLELIPTVVPIPTTSDLIQLNPFIPLMFRGQPRWFMRFCTRVDGTSMSTLMRKVADVTPLIIFILATNGDRFGAFVGDELVYHREHYGSDRSMLFRLSDPGFSVWSATGNSGGYYLLVNEKGITVGSDVEGNVGLYIDYELASGETHACASFANEPLTSSGFRFEISVLEIYAFEPATE